MDECQHQIPFDWGSLENLILILITKPKKETRVYIKTNGLDSLLFYTLYSHL